MLAVRNSESVWPPFDAIGFWTLTALGLLGSIDAFRLPYGATRKGRTRASITDIADEGGQVAAYLATYLLPFLGIQVKDWRDLTALLIYLAVLLVVFLRSDLALVNPALYITGWRVMSARRDGDRVLILVPRRLAVLPGDCYVRGFGKFLIYDSEAL